MQRRVMRQEHAAHAAVAQQTFDAIAADDFARRECVIVLVQALNRPHSRAPAL
jgi:hypothetical protein